MHFQIASFLLPCTFLHLEIVYWSKLIFATILILVQKDIMLSDQISDQGGGHFGHHGWCRSVRFFLWYIDHISFTLSQTYGDVVVLLLVVMEVVIMVVVFSLVMAIVAVVMVQGSSYKLHLNRLFPGRLEVDTVVRGTALLDERVVSRRNWYLLLTSASNKRYPETPLTLKHKMISDLTSSCNWKNLAKRRVRLNLFMLRLAWLVGWVREGGEEWGLDMVGQDRRGIQGGTSTQLNCGSPTPDSGLVSESCPLRWPAGQSTSLFVVPF